jgi:cytochrome c
MRANHMKMLAAWRDEAVRNGNRLYAAKDGRTFEKSLTGTCIQCHANKEQFCDRCHNYVGAKPTCFSCHIVPGEVKK